MSLKQGLEEETKVGNAMKTNVKAFYAYGRARQKTKARVGPFLDAVTGIPNPDPDYAAKILSAQYISVFTSPRQKYLVDNLEESSVEGLNGDSNTRARNY